MSFVVDGLVPWTVPPDWSGNGVLERLNWLTDYMSPQSGAAQKRELREAPRRGFDFDVLATGRDRRLVDALLFDHSGQVFALPIWHDVQRLTAPLALGATSIPCRTDGFDFVVGGTAMLWRAANAFELVVVDSIAVDAITLVDATVQAWPTSTRLYPTRAAHLDDWPEQHAFNDVAGKQHVAFLVDEPCDWPAVLPATTYRGYPVLEHRSDEGADPTSSYGRRLLVCDNEVGLVSRVDWADVTFRSADHRWLLNTRAENTALRSLFYGLRGRIANLWLPSGAADLQLVATTLAASATLRVDWCGYTVFGRGQMHRRDVRIQLRNGTVYYRRLTAWAEDGESELLTMDAALGVDLTLANVRLISFLTFAEQASDAIEILHTCDADGLTRAATQFVAVNYDV
jgi:hypothetical protein